MYVCTRAGIIIIIWWHARRAQPFPRCVATRQEGRSDARRNADLSPRLSGLRSLSIVGRCRPLGQRQSTGRRSVDARSARMWSSEAADRAICPNSLRRRCCISEETGGWFCVGFGFWFFFGFVTVQSSGFTMSTVYSSSAPAWLEHMECDRSVETAS